MANILVVDDDVIYINLLGNILTNENHNVVFATDGEEALKLCESQKFDLIVTDILMPNVDGIDLILDLINKYNSNTPVIAISAGNNSKVAAALNLQVATALGVSSTLQKPFSSERLIDAVKGALSQ